MYSFFCGVLAGALTLLSFPPFGASYLIWFSFVPIYHVYLRGGSLKLALLGWGWVFFAFELWSLPKDVFFLLMGASLSQILVLGVILDRLVKGKFLPIYLLFPFLWVLFEFAQSIGFMGIPFLFFKNLSIPWLSLGVALYSHPSRYVASFLGVWGLSFFAVTVSGVVHYLLSKRKILSFAFIVSLFISMSFIPEPSYEVSSGVKVGLVQPCLGKEELSLPTAALSRSMRLSGLLSLQKSLDLIVWPVSCVDLEASQGSLGKYISTFAKEYQCFILAGVEDDKDMLFYSIDGEIKHAFRSFYRLSSLKEILGTSDGDKDRVIKLEKLSLAPFKGVEIGRSLFLRKAIIDKASLLVGISNDDSLTEILFANAVIRSIETGSYFVFSSNTGPSALISPNGGSKALPPYSCSTLFGEVSVHLRKTPFVIFGCYWVPILGVLLFVDYLLKLRYSTFYLL